MSLVEGTNYGFVASAPVADPSGAGTFVCDGKAFAIKGTSPAGAAVITEIGWWCDSRTASSNFEVALYSHDSGNNKPLNRLYVDAVNDVGSGGTWQTVSVSWDISAETVYWMAFQVDAAAGSTYSDWDSVGGARNAQNSSTGSLADPWNGTSTQDNVPLAIYVVYSSATTYNVTGQTDGVSTVSGAASVYNVGSVTGTVAASSTVSGGTTVKANWQTDTFKNAKRLIIAGNDSIYYEDI